MKLHFTGMRADWVGVPVSKQNNWQRLAARSFGILTPANGISLVGLVCIVIGLLVMSAHHLWWGIGLLGVGRLADVLDGTVAQYTQTKGPVGEAVDAISDKIAAILVISYFIVNNWLPLIPLILVGLHVIVNSLLASIAWVRKQQLHPSASGKYSTVCAWMILLIFSAAYAVGQMNALPHTTLLLIGYVTSVIFIFLAAQTASSYYVDALKGIERRNKTMVVACVSGFRILASIMIIIFGMHNRWLIVFVLALVAFITDYLDGWLARKWKVVSTFGMAFDPLADKVVCLTLLAIAGLEIQSWYWLLFVIFALYDTFTMTMRFVLPNPMPASRIAKLKTSLLMVGLLTLIIGLYSPFAAILAAVILVFATVLTVWSLSGYIHNIVSSLSWLEFTDGVESIDFPEWHKSYGIETILFDIDGTLTPWDEEVVDNQVLLALKRAKKSGIKRLGLVSNMQAKKLLRLESIAKQVDAVTYHLPKNLRTRKPSTFMIYEALRESQSSTDQTAFVGDKIVDVLAAHRAGLKRVAWVKRLGDTDHISDRLVYRPLEKLFMRIVR